MRKIIVLLILFLITASAGFAQNFRASAQPDVVGVGDRIQISFSIDVEVSGFKPPRFDGFKLLMGPSTSQNVSIINGRMSRTISWTYVLEAQKEGNYKIPPATVTYNGNDIRSNQVDIVVTKPTQAKLDQMKKTSNPKKTNKSRQSILSMRI